MPATHSGAIISAGILIGVGLGGFIDGIVLHQILQWHNMLSSVVPPVDLVSMKYNMVWDGLFHALTWLMTAAGITRLWLAGRRADVPWSTSTFVGSMATGWGLFNFVEGVIDHHLLGVHHVHPGGGELAWDLAFLASGILLVGLGWMGIRRGRRDFKSRGSVVPGAEPAATSRLIPEFR